MVQWNCPLYSTRVVKAGYERLVQTFDDWLGIAENLPQWTEIVIAEHAKRFSPPEDVGAEQSTVYAPDVAQKQRRTDAWIPVHQCASHYPRQECAGHLRPTLDEEDGRVVYEHVRLQEPLPYLRQTALLDPKIPCRVYAFNSITSWVCRAR